MSNCRLNLVRNFIICSLNLSNFKFPCPNLIILLSLAKALCLKLLVSFKFCFLYAWVRVFKLNFAYELAKFGKRNIVLIILFMWWLNLMRNLLVYGLNAVNFNFRLPKFIPPFLPPLTWVLCWNLTKQTPSNKVNLNFLWVYKFMVRVRVFRLNLVRNLLVCSLNL